MTEESEKPPEPPRTFALRPPTKKEIEAVLAERRKKARDEREARRPHATTLVFHEHGEPVAWIHTEGWEYDAERSGDDFVTLKQKLGPSIQREQKVPSRGLDAQREQELTAFLDAEMKAGSEAVVLKFVDDVP